MESCCFCVLFDDSVCANRQLRHLEVNCIGIDVFRQSEFRTGSVGIAVGIDSTILSCSNKFSNGISDLELGVVQRFRFNITVQNGSIFRNEIFRDLQNTLRFGLQVEIGTNRIRLIGCYCINNFLHILIRMTVSNNIVGCVTYFCTGFYINLNRIVDRLLTGNCQSVSGDLERNILIIAREIIAIQRLGGVLKRYRVLAAVPFHGLGGGKTRIIV